MDLRWPGRWTSSTSPAPRPATGVHRALCPPASLTRRNFAQARGRQHVSRTLIFAVHAVGGCSSQGGDSRGL